MPAIPRTRACGHAQGQQACAGRVKGGGRTHKLQGGEEGAQVALLAGCPPLDLHIQHLPSPLHAPAHTHGTPEGQ